MIVYQTPYRRDRTFKLKRELISADFIGTALFRRHHLTRPDMSDYQSNRAVPRVGRGCLIPSGSGNTDENTGTRVTILYCLWDLLCEMNMIFQ